MSLLNVPGVLKSKDHWVVWKTETRDGRPTKPPFDANQNGKHVHAETNNAATWASFDRAVDASDILLGSYEGAGFVFTDTDYVGVDLDGVVREDKTIDPFAVEILKLANTYSELSPSGTGIHLIFESSLPLPVGNRKGSKKLGGEIYNKTSPRYFTVTGDKTDLSADDITKIDDPEKIALLHFMVLHLHDTKLTRLWVGDSSLWMGPNAKYPSQSEADEALCRQLAGILNYDARKIEAYFSASRLGQRDKWITREDYRVRTIKLAIGNHHPADAPDEPKTQNNCSELTLDLVPLASVEEEVQEWLWENRIPKAALMNLSGDADKGKSLVLYDILSRISTGTDFPDGALNPFGGVAKKVILLFAEGSLKTTVKPRMRVMGANMANIITLKSVSRKGEKDKNQRQFHLEKDLDMLREALRRDPDIAVIAFDPLTNYLGDDCNMNASQDVRRVLTPLGELAEESGVTVIAILHFSKNLAMSAIHRTGGAAALVEVPRAAWCCLDDDDPENKNGFVFLRLKNNLGKRVGGLRYHIEETFIDIRGTRASQPKLVWNGFTDKSADELLSVQTNPEMKGAAKARAWLEAIFADGKARPSADIFRAAQNKGLSGDVVKKARRDLRMEAQQMPEGFWCMRRRQGQSVPWVIASDLDENPATDPAEDGAE